MEHSAESKKAWTAPRAVRYGTVAELTRTGTVTKSKHLGSIDDFGIAGISTPPA